MENKNSMFDLKLQKLINKNFNKISTGAQSLFVRCVESFYFGSTWGFVKRDESHFDETIAALQSPEVQKEAFMAGIISSETEPVVALHKVNNGVLVECLKEQYLFYILTTLLDGKCPISHERLVQRKGNEYNEFKKWFQGMIKNINKKAYAKRVQGGYVVKCAMLAVNDSHEIRTRDIAYKAFKLTLPEFLEYFASAGDFSKIEIEIATDKNGGRVFENIASVYQKSCQNPKYADLVYRAGEISASNTGLFVNILIRG